MEEIQHEIDLDTLTYYQEQYLNVEQKLTKYKRAFKILKGSFELKKGENMNRDTIYLADMGSFEIELTKEEYELLEELMKSEETQN